VARWSDPLCEGPLREWPDDAARRTERAHWLAARYGHPEAELLREQAAADEALESAATEDEVVLWFEHDLFDQAILVFLLQRLADLAPERTSLICIDRHPAVSEFVGLGQLAPNDLADLYPRRIRVRPDQFALARRVWRLLCGSDPEGVWALGEDRQAPLPFLGRAMRRYLAELPSVRTGLSQTEELGLHAVAAGADTPRHAFVAAQRFEEAPWQGDAMFYATLRGLAEGPAPLVRPVAGRLPSVEDPAFADVRLELTPEGRAVVTGRLDWCRIGMPPRRLGGIPIEGPEPAWRWDDRRGRPVAGTTEWRATNDA
jgi:hypothetical protein